MTLHLSDGMPAGIISLQKDILERSRRNQEGGQTSDGEPVMYRRVFNGPAGEVAPSREQEKLGEAVVDRNDEVDLESVRYHYDATILVPNSVGHEPMMVGAVLDSGSGVTCISEKVASCLAGCSFRGSTGCFSF